MGVRKIFYFNDYVEKFLLDDHPAVFAISYRQLSSTANAAFAIRRSSDNAQISIRFNQDGRLDTASILNFVGHGIGYVTVMYNQGYGGTRYNAVQPNHNLQPAICINGVLSINSDTGKADANYDGSKYLTVDNLAIDYGGNLSPRSSFVVSKHEGNVGVDDRVAFAFGSTSSNTPLQIFSRSSNTTSTSVRGNGPVIYMGVNDSSSTRLLTAQWRSNGTSRLFENSSLIQSVNVGTILFPTPTFGGIDSGGIGAFIRSGVSHKWRGNISEVIFRTEIDEVGREAITNNIAEYYNL